MTKVAAVSGRQFSRRNVLRAGGALLGAGAGGAMLSGCGGGFSSGGSGSSSGKSLVFAAQKDDTGTMSKLVQQFNKKNSAKVSYHQLPQTSNDVYQQYVSALSGGATTPDVLQIDVIWPAAFAASGWLKDLSSLAGNSFTSQFFDTSTQAGTVNGKLVAAQQYIDTGVLYYRKDLLAAHHVKVPTTMDELVTAASTLQKAQGSPNFHGFVFEGAQIEAIVDEWFEWLFGLGGTGSTGQKLKVDTPDGVQALTYMHDLVWKQKVAPNNTSTLAPADALVLMQNGNAGFMRNWTFAAAQLDNAKASKVAGKIGVAPLPGKAGVGHGCTGGWMLAINAKSKNDKLAWQFIKYMTSTEAQVQMALGSGLLPSRPDAYDDAQVKAKRPTVAEMHTILAQSKSRPQIKDYTGQSSKVQPQFNACMANQKSPQAAISAATATLGSG